MVTLRPWRPHTPLSAEQRGGTTQLASCIDDWQGVEDHEHFVSRLQQAFGAKWSFWQMLER